jgi:hypothetical protein
MSRSEVTVVAATAFAAFDGVRRICKWFGINERVAKTGVSGGSHR